MRKRGILSRLKNEKPRNSANGINLLGDSRSQCCDMAIEAILGSRAHLFHLKENKTVGNHICDCSDKFKI